MGLYLPLESSVAFWDYGRYRNAVYSKLFASILDSSIWLEPSPTRIVWLTLLAAKDGEGFARFASVENLARRAVVPLNEVVIAIAKLEAPDSNSSNPDHEGRRIERVPGGWMVLNAKLYDDMVRREDERRINRERVRRHRAKGAKPEEGEAGTARERLLVAVPDRRAWEAEMNVAVEGMHGPPLTAEQIEVACRDFLGNGGSQAPSLRHFRAYLRDAGRPSSARQSPRKAAQGGARNDAALESWLRKKEAEGGN